MMKKHFKISLVGVMFCLLITPFLAFADVSKSAYYTYVLAPPGGEATTATQIFSYGVVAVQYGAVNNGGVTQYFETKQKIPYTIKAPGLYDAPIKVTYNVYQTKNNNKLAAKCMFTLKRGEILSNSMLTLWASSHANLGAKTHKQICSTIVPTVVKSSAAAATTTITFPSTYNL